MELFLDNINPKINDNHLTFDIGNVDPNSTVIINYKAYANEEINLDEPLSNQASVYAKRVNRIDSNLVNIEQNSHKSALPKIVQNNMYITMTY